MNEELLSTPVDESAEPGPPTWIYVDREEQRAYRMVFRSSEPDVFELFGPERDALFADPLSKLV